MNLTRKTNPNDLTDDEIAFLRGNTVPPEVKSYLARQHENIGTKISAYRKVAAAADAERAALLAVQDLTHVHGELAHVAEAQEKVKQLERRTQALEATVSAKDQRIMELTAGPAMVVHSGD